MGGAVWKKLPPNCPALQRPHLECVCIYRTPANVMCMYSPCTYKCDVCVCIHCTPANVMCVCVYSPCTYKRDVCLFVVHLQMRCASVCTPVPAVCTRVPPPPHTRARTCPTGPSHTSLNSRAPGVGHGLFLLGKLSEPTCLSVSTLAEAV